jgi:hypothetical protein
MQGARPGLRKRRLPAGRPADQNASRASSWFLTGPGLIRFRIRGRNGGLESHQHYDASVVYERLKR